MKYSLFFSLAFLACSSLSAQFSFHDPGVKVSNEQILAPIPWNSSYNTMNIVMEISDDNNNKKNVAIMAMMGGGLMTAFGITQNLSGTNVFSRRAGDLFILVGGSFFVWGTLVLLVENGTIVLDK